MIFSYLSIINSTKLDTYVAWNQAPHVAHVGGGGVRTQKTGSNSRTVAWGGERAAKPGDMPLMPPFHVFMLTDSRCCWQYRAHFNITLLQLGERFFKTRISSKQYKFLPGTFRIPLGFKKSKKYSSDLLQKEKEAFKIWSFSYTLLW